MPFPLLSSIVFAGIAVAQNLLAALDEDESTTSVYSSNMQRLTTVREQQALADADVEVSMFVKSESSPAITIANPQ